MISYMIVDDEEYSRHRVRQLMSAHLDFNFIGECSSGFEALNQIRILKPQIVFIDIAMPEKTGIEVAESFKGEEVIFIFITAFDDYALRSFESNTIDYLVKPLGAERFASSLNKARKYLNNVSPFIDISFLQKTTRIEIQKIVYLQAHEGFSKLICEDQSYSSNLTLESLLQKLKPFGFLQTHKSYLINKSYFKQMKRLGDRKYLIVLSNSQQSEIKVGRSFIHEIKEFLCL